MEMMEMEMGRMVMTEIASECLDLSRLTSWKVDITDPEHENWWKRYKYDIPVLHLNGMYWTKHKLDMAAGVGRAEGRSLLTESHDSAGSNRSSKDVSWKREGREKRRGREGEGRRKRG
eukprot:757476-Hanusia_phi.AAC.1